MKLAIRLVFSLLFLAGVYAALSICFPAPEIKLPEPRPGWASSMTRKEFRRRLDGIHNYPTQSEYRQRLDPNDVRRTFDPPARTLDLGGGLLSWQWDCADGRIEVMVQEAENQLVDVIAVRE